MTDMMPVMTTTKDNKPMVLGTASWLAAGAVWINQSPDVTLGSAVSGPLDVVVVVFGWFFFVGAWNLILHPSKLVAGGPEKVLIGLIVLGLVAGVGSEVAECVAGTHFGDPGDGSNPFDQFCPNPKQGSVEAGS